jgi:hypothetical protein
MLMALAGAATALVSIAVGFVVGTLYGIRFAYKLLEREGRLRPVTPPAIARTDP